MINNWVTNFFLSGSCTASEFRNWLLFYGIPCMQGILQDHFLYHFALLVEGIYIILGDEITEDLLKRAKCLLLEFYKLYLDYYGLWIQ